MAISAATLAKRAKTDSRDRELALQTIIDFLLTHLATNNTVQCIVKEEGPLSVESASLNAIVASKATGTLEKRGISLRMYGAWFATSGLPAGAALTEPAVYKYAHHLYTDGVPCSRGVALVQALNFLKGLFDVEVSTVTKSSRIKGMNTTSLRTRQAVRQRRPLSVPMVLALEDIVMRDAGAGEPAALVAGAALFATFGRARIGDLRRCNAEPQLDVSGEAGYIETRFFDHKTARPGTRRALPIAAAAYGLRNKPWAQTRLAARRAARLSADDDGSLLPALSTAGGWSDKAYTTPEFSAAVRSVLLESGFSHMDLDNIGAHSMKATCLSWAAKHGVEKESRRMLGYHVAPGDRSMETYARDAMARPLRLLDAVLEDIRLKKFDPDATRSGAFVQTSADARERGATTPPTDAASGGSSTCPSSRSSSSSSAGSDSPRAELASATLIINKATKCGHLVFDDTKLVCGKPWPHDYELAEDLGLMKWRCPRCF